MPYQNEQEKRHKRKGLLISLFLHGGLIALGLFPFLHYSLPADSPAKETLLMVDFTDFKSSAASQSAPPANPKPEVKPEEPPEAKPKPVETAPDEEPVLPLPEEPSPKLEPTPEPTPTPPQPEAPTAPEPSVGNPSDDPTENGQGEGDAREDKAPIGDGVAFDDNAGDGIFDRRVIQRGRLHDIMVKKGTLVVNLCINPVGRVTYVEIDQDASTIQDPSLMSAAEQVARDYRFERDYSAPHRQCGRLTFIVKK